MHCWGDNRFRQLGLPDNGEENVTFAAHDYFISQLGVRKVACGGRHTLFLQEDGIVLSCGQNNCGQLGRKTNTSSLEQIYSLEAQTILDVSCGFHHSVAICNEGNIFTWGEGSQGQLGSGQFPPQSPIPRKITGLSDIRIIQISCGHFHTVALSEDSNVFSWGKNDVGQLGLGKQVPNQASPQLVKSLKGVPLVQVSAGGSQSFALSMLGIVFGWGKNNAGQLGLQSDALKGVFKPYAISSLRDKDVIYISCGDEHTAVLSKAGTVYTFGDGSYGQLGKSSVTHTSVPQKVEEYEGQVSQIACGSYHTLLYVFKSHQIVSFGPGLQVRPDNPPSEVSLASDISSLFNSKDLKDIHLKQIFAGHNVNFVTSTVQPQTHTITLVTANLQKICRLDGTLVKSWIDTKSGSTKRKDAKREINKMFSSPACLTASFIKKSAPTSDTSLPVVDLVVADQMFTKLCQNKWIADIICSSLKNELIPATDNLPNLFEALSIFLLIPSCPIMHDDNICLPLAAPFAQAINNLSSNALKMLEALWSSLLEPSLMKQIQMFKIALVISVFSDKVSTKCILDVLKKLYKANMKAGYKVPINYFCVLEVSNVIIVPADLNNWRAYQRQSEAESLASLTIYCRYPFILTFDTKVQYLIFDAFLKKEETKVQASQVLLLNRMQGNSDVPRIPFLHFKLRRQHLLEDALKKLSIVEDCDLKKELQVEYNGEVTTDNRAAMTKFFHFVAEKMVQPDYGLFTCSDPLLPIWFPNHPLVDKKMYYHYGILCGLAVFNQFTIYLPFPLALFKKLLGKKVTLEDLKELQPTVGKSMQSLLDTENEKDVENLHLYFNLSWENKTVELNHSGATERVTHLNKQDYVNKCVDYIFNTSVAETYEEFKKGLYKVCDKDIFLFFQPEELMTLVAGHTNYNWTAFEQTTVYMGKYSAQHPTIISFWKVFHQLPLEKKKAFLYFITGNNKIPALVAQNICMKVSSFGVPNENYLPEANTCTRLLFLPDYSSHTVLRKKLLLALENNKGFEKD
ncbi:putative E3 ubiquitin-protein ligase HERC6 isoform 2-T2 [Anomaloglossus baeobatrachus]|uniref:putative E3 ubiquitin-protein ligase HERC6 n=1 Tax=Anomaloglossus baeobatrachus TaxID=238106 RepID=UPI003F4F9463